MRIRKAHDGGAGTRYARMGAQMGVGVGRILILAAALLGAGASSGTTQAAGGQTERSASPPCETLPDRIYALAESNRVRSDADAARTLLRRIQAARACILHGSLADENRRMTAWLMVNEVFALDLLHRTDHALQVVETFFTRVAASADSMLVAKMHMWNTHLQVQRGNVTAGLNSHGKAEDYARHLPPLQRSGLKTNEAFFLRETGRHKRAREVAAQAEQILRTWDAGRAQGSSAYRSALGRAMYQQAASLAPDHPGDARRLYEQILTLYPPSDLAPVLIGMGEAFAVENRLDSALVYFDRGQAVADEHGATRHRVRARLLRGVAYASSGRLEDAQRALVDAATIVERGDADRYLAHVHATLGEVYERQSEPGAALEHYRRAARHSVDRADARAVQAKLDAQQGVIRLLESRRSWLGRTLGPWLDVLVGGLFVLAIVVAVRSVLRRSPSSAPASAEPAPAAPPADPAASPDLRCDAPGVPDASPHRVLQACQTYVALWRAPDAHFAEGERHRHLARTRQAVFAAAMKWMYGDDVWDWLDTLRNPDE